MTCPEWERTEQQQRNPPLNRTPLSSRLSDRMTKSRRTPMMSPAHPPHPLWPPSPSPSPAGAPNPPPLSDLLPSSNPAPASSKQQPIDFSPPLIAMVVIAAAAFLIVTYSRLLSRHLLPPLLRQLRRYRRWRRRRRQLLPSSRAAVADVDSPPYDFDGLHHACGLEDSVIKSMPLSLYSDNNKSHHHRHLPLYEIPGDCAVCLVEFVDRDYVRTLPLCAHSFHVDCIDVWLRSHATCPLCRAGVLPPREWSPFIPADHGLLLDSIYFIDPPATAATTVPEIVPEIVPERPRLLKRSYSFGFERNFSSERLVMEPATASPWRHHSSHHQRRRSLSFWRRPSPFPRVFSFRSSRKSPFSGRRRGGGNGGGAFVAVSESAGLRYAYYSKSMMASPLFGRASVSSRMRCGDPEALISPERYGGR